MKAYSLDGNCVVLGTDDFSKASPEKSKVIAIDAFIAEHDIGSIYFEKQKI